MSQRLRYKYKKLTYWAEKLGNDMLKDKYKNLRIDVEIP